MIISLLVVFVVVFLIMAADWREIIFAYLAQADDLVEGALTLWAMILIVCGGGLTVTLIVSTFLTRIGW